MSAETQTVHGTAVCVAGQALMFVGPSGSGKSGFALQMLSFGATLIADDKVILTLEGEDVIASCPPQLTGLIEARGIGVLNAPKKGPTPLKLVVDLSQFEAERYPPPRSVTYLDRDIPLLWRTDSPHFSHALLHLLTHGRSAR